MKDARQTPEPRCPSCDEEIDLVASESQDASAPNSGAFVVCLKCGTISTFRDAGGHLVLFVPNREDLLALWCNSPGVFDLLERVSYEARMGNQISITNEHN